MEKPESEMTPRELRIKANQIIHEASKLPLGLGHGMGQSEQGRAAVARAGEGTDGTPQGD